MIYSLCKEINFYSPCMTNTQDVFLRCIKYYPYNFLQETFIQKNGYQLYQWSNNDFTYEILHS